MGRLLAAVSQLDHLYHAWQAVRPAARGSPWSEVREQFADMEAAPLRSLRELQRQLRAGSYVFAGKRGYTKRKSGGSRRGITIQPLYDRLVQRAILNLFYSSHRRIREQLGAVAEVLDCPTSFAGTPGRGVPEAVSGVVAAIRQGSHVFGLSDVKDFFPRIPRREVVQYVRENVEDAEFVDLFAQALTTRLVNQDEVSDWLELFPVGDVGVAQGSLLSVLVGNLALRDFDRQLNESGLVTIRYLDDFCILGSSRPEVTAAFARAQTELDRLGMTCYAPGDGSQKAALGDVARGLEFLGCRIHPSGVAPARRSRRQLHQAIRRVLADARTQLLAFVGGTARRRTEAGYLQSLARIDRLVRGWGDAYRFVSNRVVFAQVDRMIDRQLASFEQWYRRRFRAAPPAVRRRLQGIALLQDTPATQCQWRQQ